MFNKNQRIVLVVVLCLLGTAIGVQFKSVFQVNKTKLSASEEVAALTESLGKEKDKGIELIKEINEAEGKKESYIENETTKYKAVEIKKLMADRDRYKLQIGLTTVRGEGITIHMDDAEDAEGFAPELVVIHNSDIYRVLNELKKAGAQAISINDERIIWSSEQVCAGPTIRINKRKYAVPYTIKAIGNQDALYENLQKSSVIAEFLDFNIRVTIEKENDMIIPKYNYNTEELIDGLEVANDENE